MPAARLETSDGNTLVVIDAQGGRVPVHPLWLREQCGDPASLDPLTGQRLYDPSDLDPDLRIMSIVEPRPGRYEIVFSDGHRSTFRAAEILAEALTAPGRDGAVPPEPWDGRLSPLPRARWRETPGEAERLAMVETFLRLGFVILEGVPAEPGRVLTVAREFGFPRDTNFGVLFDVRSVPAATDLAYTGLALDPHTDNPYRAPVPGIQLLHCLINRTAGGLSTLVDGFAVAAALRERDAAAFERLAATPVRFRYADAETELEAWAPIVERDVAGRLQTIRFSPRLDFVPLLPPDELAAFYAARRQFDRLLKSSEFEIRFRLEDGDLVMFDNTRLLHGRTGFDPAEGPRHLQGCYIDLDAPRSLHRVLRRKLARPQAAA